MSLMDKLKKNTRVDIASVLEESMFFTEKDAVETNIIGFNIGLGGSIHGGLLPGALMLAGPSKHFKTGMALSIASSYLDKFPDSVMLFYDSEFGSPQSYFQAFGIDTKRVFHTPVTDIEQLKFDIMNQLKELKRGDKVIIVIDSIGNLASKKEVDDAENEKSVADMSRAKQIKSLFRMVTPHLTIKDISLIAVNHTYKEMCLDGETRVKTTKGIKPIKDILVGDEVYALTGIQRVVNTFSPEDLDSNGKMFLELEFDDGSNVKCTHDHKFFTVDKKWVKAIDLKINQIMA